MRHSHVAGEEYGFLHDEELEKLGNSLSEGPRNHLVCIHHPATPLDSAWIDSLMLRNPEALFDAVRLVDGNLVFLCGHAHQEYVKVVDGLTLLGTPSTCFQFKPGTAEFELDDLAPGFRVIELNDSGGFSSGIVRQGDP